MSKKPLTESVQGFIHTYARNLAYCVQTINYIECYTARKAAKVFPPYLEQAKLWRNQAVQMHESVLYGPPEKHPRA